MDILSNPKAVSVLKEKIRASELIGVLPHYGHKIKILSLDCFDTLLWRKAASPTDVFYELQHRPAFNELGITGLMRIRTEMHARMLKALQHGSNEVNLREIYQAFFPDLTEEQLTALEEDELAAEIETCYAFPPVVELIREANSKGIRIVIVSDTYLKQHQLQRLLSSALPADVMSAIEMVFCSNEFNRSKVNGLFKHVLEHTHQQPESILHIGDNPFADFEAARAIRINALHLIQHDPSVSELFRMEITAASFMNPRLRDTRGIINPFRGVLACTDFAINTPVHLIGYAIMGPILYAFARFIHDEVKELKINGKNPKVLFLMRDAYLPSLVCEAMLGQPLGSRVRISRFAAIAATFRNENDVENYLTENVATANFAEMIHQLLLPKNIAEALLQETQNDAVPVYKFIQLIRQKDVLATIFKQSALYRKKLIRHIHNEIELKTGDTLVFVDLGYGGTTQKVLEPVLQDELGIEVIGRYLISASSPNSNKTRKGLLEPSSCDERTLLMLVSYIALFEQLCTTHENSVIDYDNAGQPIFSEAGLSMAQHHELELIQAQCIRFAKDAEKFFQATNMHLSLQMLQDAVMTGISRLLFLPTADEIKHLESFKFDLSLGTHDVFSIFDQEKGIAGLRRRGLFSSFMEKNAKSYRSNAPAELRAAGLELSLTFMAHHRFSLDFLMKDMSLRKEALNAIIMRGSESSQVSFEASLTHDGFYSLWVPTGSGNLKTGILFGKKYKWVQLESAELILAEAFLSPSESQYTEDAWGYLKFEKMTNKGGKLFECLSDGSFMLIDPPHKNGNNNYILRVIFRPIANRNENE